MSVRPFTPSQEPVEDLDRRTVGRERLLGVLDQRLRQAATSATRQHTLLVGPRGSGKTHLLSVALHRTLADPQVGSRLAVARIPEDAIGVNSYTDLLRDLARELGAPVGLERNTGVLERALLGAAGDRTLVIVIENLDRVFRSLGLAGQRDLRSWVETSGRVLILAATPALFDSIRQRDKPWFGGLIETPVDGLTAAEGRELLTLLAADRGDQGLVDLLQSPRGEARVKAVGQLTAGSARIWMVLSECLTVESLDELIPAVEALIEDLVPYYQSLLWDLPDNQQAIVRQLAEGAWAAYTASEIAAATGLSQQTVSKALSLLKEGRWVRDEKLHDDQRRTFYSLREPMLRHHFQWRATQGEPLRLIVELLKEWYEPGELRKHLASAGPGSPGERYLVESLRSIPTGYDWAMNAGSPDELLSEARRWMAGGDRIYPAETGLYAELCVTALREPTADLAELAQRRHGQYHHLPTPPADTLAALAAEASAGSGLADLLVVCAQQTTGDVSDAIRLIAAGLIGWNKPQSSCDLLADAQADPRSPLGLAIGLDRAFWRSNTGHLSDSIQVVSNLLPTIIEVLGPDDPMALTARNNLAQYIGETGDAVEALRLYREVLSDRERVLGADDRDTLIARYQVAYYTGVTGDTVEALRLYREVLADCERVLGADDRATLIARHQVAYYTGVTGDTVEALRLYQELLADYERVLGADDRATLNARSQVANYTRKVGDPSRVDSGRSAVQLVIQARGGDQEALIRLPRELRPLVGGPPE